MKTAAALLQEVMVKMGKVPEYECIAQTGPSHQAKFEYCCKAHGLTVTAIAPSKKDAKQEAARLMLEKLAGGGVAGASAAAAGALAHFGSQRPEHCSAVASCNRGNLPATAAGASYVSLLIEFSTEQRLPAPQYELCATSGPPHLRHFTVRARLADHHRSATSTTLKSARQLAAQQLYTYLKENLAEVKREAGQRSAAGERGALDAVMQRCLQTLRGRTGPAPGRSAQPAHIHIDAERRPAVLAALEAHRAQAPELALAAVARALGLRVERRALPAAHGALVVLELAPAAPPLAVAARDAPAAAAAALRCLCRVIAAP